MLPKGVPLSWSEILLSLATNVHERETGVAVAVGVGVRLGSAFGGRRCRGARRRRRQGRRCGERRRRASARRRGRRHGRRDRDGEGRGRRRRRRVQLRRDAEVERLLDVERLAAELVGGVGADRREARLELHLVTEQLLAVELGARLLVVLVGRHAEPPELHDVHGERAELVDDDRRDARGELGRPRRGARLVAGEMIGDGRGRRRRRRDEALGARHQQALGLQRSIVRVPNWSTTSWFKVFGNLPVPGTRLIW